jgi:cobalt/nickel transport system permease protein
MMARAFGKLHMRTRRLIERTTERMVTALERAFYAEELARANGLLQGMDARVKTVGILALVIAAAVAHRLWVLLALWGVAAALGVASRVPLKLLAKRVWIAVLAFTGLVALPAPFLTPGRQVARLPILGWRVTAQGLTAASFLIARVEVAATLAVLLVLCTPWSSVLKALRALRVPVVVIVILGTTVRYIFLLVRTAHEMFESRRSRLVGELSPPERRRMVASAGGVLISKSFHLSAEVYEAMQSRGFRGDVFLVDDFQAKSLDWIALAVFLSLAVAAAWVGR